MAGVYSSLLFWQNNAKLSFIFDKNLSNVEIIEFRY